jgi:hypothetical protein
MAMEPSSSGNEEQQQQQEKKASQLFAQRALQERRLKPPDQVMACPRCQSLNTKFCYYNNYSLTQPRHFCKNCRRYWTAGGTLRNVPVGGGCRKNKRAKHRNSADGQSSSGTAGNTESDLFGAAQQQQHTRLGSSSASFFDSEEGKVFANSQEATWSQSQGASHSGEAGPAFAHSSQGLSIGQHSQPFESGIMSLGLFNSVRPDAGLSMHTSQQVPGGDLSVFFDNSAYSRAGALAALSEGHGSYNQTNGEEKASSYGRGDIWRNLQQPKQEGLWSQDQESMQGSLDLNRQQAKSKFTAPSLSPTHGLGEESPQPAAVAWQQSASQGGVPHYETAPDTGFWSNSGWPPVDMHALHGSGGPRLL